jgi:hypothetical protein
MRDDRRPFEQQQTFVWRTWKNPPSAGVLRQGSVVKIGVKAEQRQLKAVLPARLAVAGPRAAPLGNQDWLYVELKADRLVRRKDSWLAAESDRETASDKKGKM